MTDLTLNWPTTGGGPDIVLDGSDLVVDDGLATAALVALFSDARAAADDGLPEGADPRGHWGDAFTAIPVGSLLWLLAREKITPDLAPRIRERAREALQRSIVAPGLAQAVDVTVTRAGLDAMALEVTIDAPAQWPGDSGNTPQQFDFFGLDVTLVIRADQIMHPTLAQFEGI